MTSKSTLSRRLDRMGAPDGELQSLGIPILLSYDMEFIEETEAGNVYECEKGLFVDDTGIVNTLFGETEEE